MFQSLLNNNLMCVCSQHVSMYVIIQERVDYEYQAPPWV